MVGKSYCNNKFVSNPQELHPLGQLASRSAIEIFRNSSESTLETTEPDEDKSKVLTLNYSAAKYEVFWKLEIHLESAQK